MPLCTQFHALRHAEPMLFVDHHHSQAVEPDALLDQLEEDGGRLVIPVGDRYQELLRITRREDGVVDQERIIPVRFVPMTGEAERQ